MEETPTSTLNNDTPKNVIDIKDELDGAIGVHIDVDDDTLSINTVSTSRLFAKRKNFRDASLVREHFKKIEGLPAHSPKVACNYCEKQYYCHSKRNGTSSMITHLEN